MKRVPVCNRMAETLRALANEIDAEVKDYGLPELEKAIRKAGTALNDHMAARPECHWYEPEAVGIAEAHGGLQEALRLIGVLAIKLGTTNRS